MPNKIVHQPHLVKNLNRTLKELINGKITQCVSDFEGDIFSNFIPSNINYIQHLNLSFIAKRIIFDYVLLSRETTTNSIATMAGHLAKEIVQLALVIFKERFKNRDWKIDHTHFHEQITIGEFEINITEELTIIFKKLMRSDMHQNTIDHALQHILIHHKLLGYTRTEFTSYTFDFISHEHKNEIEFKNKTFAEDLNFAKLATKSQVEFMRLTRPTMPYLTKLVGILAVANCSILPVVYRMDSINIFIRLSIMAASLLITLQITRKIILVNFKKRRLSDEMFHRYLSRGSRIELDILPHRNHQSSKCRCCECVRYSKKNQDIIVMRTILKSYQDIPLCSCDELEHVAWHPKATIVSTEIQTCAYPETITTRLVAHRRGGGALKTSLQRQSYPESQPVSANSSQRTNHSEDVILPSGESGSLIFGRNHRVMLIYKNDKSEKDSEIDYDESSSCGLREARAKGQGGYKHMRKDIGSIKFSGSRRIICNREDNIDIEIDGEIKSVPSFRPAKEVTTANKKKAAYKRL